MKSNEIWHIDTTVVRLLDGSKAYLHAVIDNYSPWGQKTQPSTKHCKKATSKRLSGIQLSRTGVLSTAVMFLRSF